VETRIDAILQLGYFKAKQIIAAGIKEHILDETEQMIHVGRYEYYCYSRITCYLENKSLFIDDSTKYHSLESELLPNWPNDASIDLDKIIRQLSTQFSEMDCLYLLKKTTGVQLYAEI